MSEGSWRGLALVCPACRGEIEELGAGARCLGCGRDFRGVDGILDMTLGRSGGAGFDPHYYAPLCEIEDRHFWFVSRRKVLLATMRRAIPDLGKRSLFDVGCGTGSLLEFFARRGVNVAGACDAYRESLQLVRRRLDVPLVLVDEGRLAPLGEGLSLVGMFDVLEHIDDDLGTLQGILRALEPGGTLVLSVPAHPALFGGMDAAAYHRRRYSRRELKKKLENAGFEIRAISHFMMLLAPVLLAARWLERIRRPRNPSHSVAGGEFRVIPIVNSLLEVGLAIERGLMALVPLPFGSSLVAVAARPRAGGPPLQ